MKRVTNSIMDILINAIVIIIVMGLYLVDIKCNKDFNLMDRESLKSIRFIFSIVIIFVHIPISFQNVLQDMIGSFAFIGVSLFDLSSSYGVKFSVDHNSEYLHLFWKKRSLEILIPLFGIALIDFIYALCCPERMMLFAKYKNIYGWILVLFEFYLIFWITYKLASKFVIINQYKDYLICFLTFTLSVLDYLFNLNIVKGWSLERLGFIVGIMIYNQKEKFSCWANRRTIKKLIFFCLLNCITGYIYIKTKNIFVISYVTKALLECSTLILIIIWISKFDTNNKFIKWGGTISYGIYLSHPLMFEMIALQKFEKNNGVDLLFVPLVVGGSIIIAWGLSILTTLLRKGFLK